MSSVHVQLDGSEIETIDNAIAVAIGMFVVDAAVVSKPVWCRLTVE
jgi:hypothetical protein